MAKALGGISGSLIGEIVYPGFNPRKVGKVIKDNRENYPTTHGPKDFSKSVVIRWLNGEISEELTLGLNSFRVLLEDTERKAKNHREIFNTAKEL